MQNESEPVSLRILVVNDGLDSTESLGLLLQCLGHDAFTAHDSFEAVAAVDIIAPQVIFLDLGLTLLDGLETARRIRRLPTGKAARIVALANSGDEALRRESLAAGCDKHWQSPADYDNLVDFLAGISPAPLNVV